MWFNNLPGNIHPLVGNSGITVMAELIGFVADFTGGHLMFGSIVLVKAMAGQVIGCKAELAIVFDKF